MNRHNRLRLTLAAGAGAAALYGSYATLAWLRYGRSRKRATASLLDRYMPDPEVVEHERIRVNAPADIAYAACRELDLMRSPAARLIFATRARVLGDHPPVERQQPFSLIEEVQGLGWRIFDEVPGREIVLGAACKPWQADPQFRTIPTEQFASFDEPGFAKIVWNFCVEPVSDQSCVVHTETRVTTTDRDSRRRFRRYWSFLSPGIVLIRLLGLKIVKSDAEKEVRHEH